MTIENDYSLCKAGARPHGGGGSGGGVGEGGGGSGGVGEGGGGSGGIDVVVGMAAEGRGGGVLVLA